MLAEEKKDSSVCSGRISKVRKKLEEDIDIASLLEKYPYDQSIIQTISGLLLDDLVSTGSTIRAASREMPAYYVKGRWMSLTFDHVDRVVEKFIERSKETMIRNPKMYLKAMLFNEPIVQDTEYESEVYYDMYGMTCMG